MAQSPTCEHDARPPFELFRAAEAIDYDFVSGSPMTNAPMTDIEAAGLASLVDGGFLEGSRLKLLYSRPGMSLTYLWFKSGYPLPRHSHDVDCLYFIVAGSLTVGNEELGPGDGFFVGSDVPYSYVPGREGVEVLEFRIADAFNFIMRAKGSAYWDRLIDSLVAARTDWPDQKTPPSGIEVG